MCKVLFLTGKLQHYRVPILNIIANQKDISLTVAHSATPIKTEGDLFEEIIIRERHFGPFTLHSSDFIDMCKKYDVVVAMFYLQKISFMLLLLYKKYFKVVYWGIGVRASQTSKFDSPSILNYLRYYIARKSDAMIFYSKYAKDKYTSKGINQEKVFVMPNTVEVLNSKSENIKDCITFIGTLNKSKQIFTLLEAYRSVYLTHSEIPRLEIIGKGEDYDNILSWVNDNKLNEKIVVHGAIYDDLTKSRILSRSYLNISPSQAGLSVLECFGYGVPFVTSKEAYTGGERFNIIDNYNGYLLNDKNLYDETVDVLLNLINDKVTFINLGINARQFYQKNRTPAIMAAGFIDAIHYVNMKQ